MNYLLDKRTIFKNQTKKKRVGKFLTVIGVMLFFYGFGSVVYPILTKPIIAGTQPLLSANNAVSRSLERVVAFFASKRYLVHDNENLRDELLKTQGALFSANTKLKNLRAIESFLPKGLDSGSFVIGQVMAKPRFMPYDIQLALVPDSLNSRQLGLKVFWSADIILGEVIQVFGNIAKIKFYSSPGVEKNVLIDNGLASTTPAVMVGTGGGNFTIRLPRGLDIANHSRVFLADNPSVVIGIVGAVVKTAEKPSQIIYVKTPVNIYTLKQVLIQNAL